MHRRSGDEAESRHVGKGAHRTVGIDLVAMSVNDALCCGAEPLFFLDYVAMSHDDPVRLEQIVEGVSNGCVQADCALLGGETAIMPDIYARDDYDLAGFCVGVAERKKLIDGRSISTPRRRDPGSGLQRAPLERFQPGTQSRLRDRRVRRRRRRARTGDQPPGRALLEPTRIYVRPVRQILSYYKIKKVVHGIAHITGGGLHENLESRILPEGIQVVIEPRQLARASRSSAGCKPWARSTPKKWTRSSIWGSAWCWSSAPTTPTAFATNSPTVVWRAGRSDEQPPESEAGRSGECGPIRAAAPHPASFARHPSPRGARVGARHVTASSRR